MQSDRKTIIYLAILLAAIAILMALRLEDAPAMFSDEGWALSVARTWAETGHYAELVLGQPVAPTALNIGLPAIAPMALSFRLLGVGIWQGRLPSIFWTLGCLLLIYVLARRLYDEKVALWSVIIATLASGWLGPILFGKQALGEMPALFFVLAGYSILAARTSSSPLRYVLAGALWGLASASKIQVMPFLILSALLLIGVALVRRERALAAPWGLSLASLAVALALIRWLQVQLQGIPAMPLTGTGLLLLTSVVTGSGPRLVTLLSVLALGLPACLGLCHAAVTAPRFWNKSVALDRAELVRWSLILFTGTWFVWYLALAAGWTRYLTIPLYASSIFVGAALISLSGGEGLVGLFRRGAQALKGNTRSPRSVLALCLLLMLVLATVWTVGSFAGSYLAPVDHSVEEVASYLNTRTAPSAVVESYEMELFPFLDRPYHYPQVASMEQLVRRNSRGEDVRVDYDPLQANPDYLVTGPVNALWGLYDEAIHAGEFEQQWSAGNYRVYRRVERDLGASP